MLKHPARFIFGIVLSAVVIYTLVSVLRENDETKIRRAIYAGIVGIEKNDAARYGRVLSSSYRDDDGRDKAAVLKITADAFREYKPFKVEIKALRIDAEGLGATSQIGFRCLFKREGDTRLYYDAGKIVASWRKEEADWKIVKIEYIGSHEILFLPAVA
jgi:hypothetical protein